MYESFYVSVNFKLMYVYIHIFIYVCLVENFPSVLETTYKVPYVWLLTKIRFCFLIESYEIIQYFDQFYMPQSYLAVPTTLKSKSIFRNET